MKLYKDIVSGDELFTDVYPIEEVDDFLYKIKGKLTTDTTDVSGINIGANQSEEAPAEDVDDTSATSGINVVLRSRLVQAAFNKKSFKVHIADYMKKVKKHLEENSGDVDTFKAKSATFIKALLEEFKEYDFYMGESNNPEAMAVMVKWDEETPYLYFFKQGIEVEKL